MNSKTVRISVKKLGDYTGRLNSVKKSTKVLIEGPLGVFTSKRLQGNKALLIAGGIGITPLRPIAEDLMNSGKTVDLIYSVNSEKDLVFDQELDNLNIGYHKNISDKKGRLDVDKISVLVPDLAEREVFLCGPASMMKTLRAQLEMFGVSRKKIYLEKFSL